MSLKNDAFPSSAAFDAINSTLQADAAERKEAINKAKAVVAFNIKNDKGQEESWYLDLKDKGVVGKGAAPEGGKADGEFNQLLHQIMYPILMRHRCYGSDSFPFGYRLQCPRKRQGQRSETFHGWEAQD
ncbi:uncharacterized protein AKAW2_51789S [Aspergillus luchuensis]|uniref:SCP2 domain-containing protein n=1 Tax=Aspergillus kawachii TaxID=1069201 RepID=A0A7R8A248_ASPKA|nr:uncharacterized protein AKAW2_51789S [Aspergillus luchuensis]BCS01448.1 hypothetical protein AKAW2_51789S [Aspergillus luchuensis]